MKIMEFDQRATQTGFYDPARDEVNTRRLDDTRKPVLTLKRMRALKKLEALKKQDLLGIMYAAPEGDGGGFGGGF